NESARAQLHDATSLAAIGANGLIPQALANGHAVSDGRPISLDRIGGDAVTVLIAHFTAADMPAAAVPLPQLEASVGGAPPSSELAPTAATAPVQVLPRAPATPTERRHPLRFVWQVDEGERFTLHSDEFIALTGARTAAAIGRRWQEVATELGLDPGGQVARAMATRDTWSGLTVSWPVDASPARLAIELAGLPVFDRNRAFRGYKGFGVCRDIAQLNALAQKGHAPATERRSQEQIRDQAADQAPASAATALATGSSARTHSAVAAVSENILHFPRAAEPHAPALSALERNAFRELSRKLAQRLTGIESADLGAPPASVEEGPTAGGAEAADRAGGGRALIHEGKAASVEPAQTEFAAFASLLETAADGLVVLDGRGLIMSASRAAGTLFGYEPHELVGRAFSDLFAPECVEAAYDFLEGSRHEAAAQKHYGGREIVGRTREGAMIPMIMSMGRTDERSDQVGVVFRDMSRWKKLELDLAAAKRQAEKASSAKADFLAKISHEIRTPLNAIIGFSEVMMAERFGPLGSERYRDYLKDIHASGGHLLSLINDLLDLSKIEAGRLELAFTTVSLNELTRECVAIMQPQANRDRIIIRTSLPPSLPQVVADARSLRQIVLNLLSNSIKFTDAGGQVIVSTALNDAGDVALRVRDTGVGMSENDLATALEPFRPLATSGSAASGSSGLGLPLTKALAEANRASFYIKSAPKAGTLVEIAFPPSQVRAS
ncbi:MAG TPA: histidine kinase dimerization/phospho-acceptor domain-containing protein, partial [Xanthobacteraceae bacterium]|nr:histidine kinase dimerization/phospho-acceptor domain-containing protein [Xanthobacteraceae bacterium]